MLRIVKVTDAIVTHNAIRRHLVPILEDTLEAVPIVNLIGPRQVGKTTLVRDLFGAGDYYTLDDPYTIASIKMDPRGHLAELVAKAGDRPVIIDEAPQFKDVALALKLIVDTNRKHGQFILAGSSNMFLFQDTPDSLAGRTITKTLWPLTATEINGAKPNRLLDWASDKKPNLAQIMLPGKVDRSEYVRLVVEGGFPRARAVHPRQRQDLYRGYVDAIVVRDVADPFKIRNLAGLRMLIDQMAARTGQKVNASDLSRHIGIKRNTVNDYLYVLERMSLVSRLDIWTPEEVGPGKKQPKYHFVDTGMNCALRGLEPASFSADSRHAMLLGGLMESWVFNELMRGLERLDGNFRLYHWRGAERREIDIVAENGGHGHIVGIKVKASSTITDDDLKHLKWFAMDGPGRARGFTGLVLYLGEHKLSFGDNCFALPVSSLWAEIGR